MTETKAPIFDKKKYATENLTEKINTEALTVSLKINEKQWQ